MSSGGAEAVDVVEQPVHAALRLARAFVAGRRLAIAAPGREDHAHHVAVEFVHPVVAGTRALPAVAVRDLGRAGADAVGLFVGPRDEARGADLFIPVDGSEVAVVRAYHLLWELVHVALEHPGLVGDAPVAGGDSTGFLYPFLDATESDEDALSVALSDSATAKVVESERIVAEALASGDGVLDRVAAVLEAAVVRGGRVHVMGNGGSAADAARLARSLENVGVAATALADDYAIVTALANDIGVDAVFARQVEALVRPGDVVIGCSTSGASSNLLVGFDAAAEAGATTVGLSGYGGGGFASNPAVHHCLVVDAMSVHRIQEAQAALGTELCGRLANRLDARRVAVPIPATGEAQ